jgi:hypothetical protein
MGRCSSVEAKLTFLAILKINRKSGGREEGKGKKGEGKERERE